MNLLLDTHIFLWFISGSPQLKSRWQTQIGDPANRVYLSVASVWEATIKYQLGKLPLPNRRKSISQNNAIGMKLRV